MSRLNRTENEESAKSSRVGLSEYTTQRLAELRARRAELDTDPLDYKSTPKTSPDTTPTSSTPTSTTLASSTVSTSDLLESYRVRRGLPTNGVTSPKQPVKTMNGTSNGISSPPAKTSPVKPVASVPGSSTLEPKVSSSGATTKRSMSMTSSALNNGTGLSHKADHGALRSDSGRTGISLNRSQSARIGYPAEGDDDCVGFASLPEQVHRKAIKRGFDFTLMVVGESGLGKSTLISSLFLNPELYKDRQPISTLDSLSRTVEIEKKYMEIEEKGVKLRLTIVDTPGFNDCMDTEQSWRPIEQYISEQFNQYLKDESGLNRKNIKDERVHCCLYFVSPYGHGLRQIDIQFMKRLHDKVNIVPVIGKSDTLTPKEMKRLKNKVLDEIDEHGIRIYEFPDCDSDEDEDFKQQDSELKAAVPFAVIGSNTVVEVGDQKLRGRLYPWGVVEVDNSEHCDFSKLRMMLISTHMQDLKDITQDVHYENFRAQHIEEQMTKNQRERNKLKRDSSPNFESIMDQSQLLEQKDEEIRRMQAMLAKMQQQLLSGKTAGHH